MWTVGVIAKMAGVNVETVRYYERRKLLPKPLRKVSGYRLYDQRSVERLLFIKRAQSLGFTLREVRDLLDLDPGDGSASKEIRGQAQEKITRLQRKISELTQMRDRLAELIDQCPAGTRSAGPCPILNTLTVADGEQAEPHRSWPTRALGVCSQCPEPHPILHGHNMKGDAS